MKIILIAGNGGSGGLIGYIKGLISANVVSKNSEIILYCGGLLAKKIDNIGKRIRVIETEFAVERGKDVLTNKRLPEPLIQKIKDENPDAILFLNGYLRSGLEAYPNIMVLHNQLYIDDYQLIRHGVTKLTLKLFAFRHAVRRSMNKADGVIFLSKFSKSQTDQKKIKYKNGKIIPFGFEKENRVTNIMEKKAAKAIKLIYISAMFPYKNHIELIKACGLIKANGHKFVLTLVGQKREPVYTKLIREIRKYGIEDNVHFADWVEHSKIKDLIDDSDIFVYASSTETTGYGLLEGMARGALIVCSNKAGFPEMLKDAGVYFEPSNIRSISNAIEKLINMSDDQRNLLRKKALKYSHEFSWEKAAINHWDYIEEVCARRKL